MEETNECLADTYSGALGMAIRKADFGKDDGDKLIVLVLMFIGFIKSEGDLEKAEEVDVVKFTNPESMLTDALVVTMKDASIMVCGWDDADQFQIGYTGTDAQICVEQATMHKAPKAVQ